jgi:hypothetical protein
MTYVLETTPPPDFANYTKKLADILLLMAGGIPVDRTNVDGLPPNPQPQAPTPVIPTPTPTPAPQPEGPAPQPEEPAPQPEGPAPQPEEPAPQPQEPAPQPEGPAPQPEGPAPQPEGPAPQPAIDPPAKRSVQAEYDDRWRVVIQITEPQANIPLYIIIGVISAVALIITVVLIISLNKKKSSPEYQGLMNEDDFAHDKSLTDTAF